ncbi:hypothetical protein ALTERO38_60741 [Alteromonas sp. 38]|nr:hypothetical protein ALTER154_40054 [Alteromonas sp. 154]VXC32222.1 hypothetical protein ALTERO38_60741 [Alteromonas sp. 38]
MNIGYKIAGCMQRERPNITRGTEYSAARAERIGAKGYMKEGLLNGG